MPSLITYLGFNKTEFSAGLGKAVEESKKAGSSIEKGLIGTLTDNPIFRFVTSPIGAATAAAGALGVALKSTFEDMRQQARDIKIGKAGSNLDTQTFQRIYLAAKGAGVGIEGLGKAVDLVAQAQQKVMTGSSGADKMLNAFLQFGITAREIQRLSFQDLFVKLTENMGVTTMSAAQVTAGVELMGKKFEDLERIGKRGLNNLSDQMQALTNEELSQIDALNARTSAMKTATKGALREVITGPGKDASLWEKATNPLTLASMAFMGFGGLTGTRGITARAIDEFVPDGGVAGNGQRLQGMYNARIQQNHDRLVKTIEQGNKEVVDALKSKNSGF